MTPLINDYVASLCTVIDKELRAGRLTKPGDIRGLILELNRLRLLIASGPESQNSGGHSQVV